MLRQKAHAFHDVGPRGPYRGPTTAKKSGLNRARAAEKLCGPAAPQAIGAEDLRVQSKLRDGTLPPKTEARRGGDERLPAISATLIFSLEEMKARELDIL